MRGFSRGFLDRNPVEHVELARQTSYRIGGPGMLVQLESREDLRELRDVGHDTPLRWLGKGANLLIGDVGVPEPVVRLGQAFATLESRPAEHHQILVRVGAGYDLAKLVGWAARSGLAGLEGLAGVPATVGGALWMNAGTATTWMLDQVERVEVLLPDEAEPLWIERSLITAAYRRCGLPAGSLVLGCELLLARSDAGRLQAEASRLKQRKAATQPLAARSAGCVFKNPSPTLPAGKLVDELGFKGARRGGAEVSDVHANFIINIGNATAEDVLTLANAIRRKAYEERGVVLALEQQLWGCPPELTAHPCLALEASS